MTSKQQAARLDYFGMVHGVTLHVIGAFSDRDLDFRPASGTRTARELIFHIYSQEQAAAEAAEQGKFSAEMAESSNPENPANAAAVRGLATVADAQTFAKACHGTADRIMRALSDEQLARRVESPMGAIPAWQFFSFAYDEHWHHRGQLYTYLRLLGKEPPMLYDY